MARTLSKGPDQIMADLFDALPGIEVPVGAIEKSLASLWEDAASSGKPAPTVEDSRATQINLVLHLGLHTTAEDAKVQFETATHFAMRYPSRVVVLCPLREDDKSTTMRAKVYGECTIGKSKQDKRCCEFVILSYPLSFRHYLESEVSICISSDLPLYYWPHRFSANANLAAYHYLLTKAKRILIDSSTSPREALSYPWPKPEAVRDLASARILHLRQAIGQFLSRYSPDLLTNNLTAVSVEYSEKLMAEGHALLAWAKDRMLSCGHTESNFSAKQCNHSSDSYLSLRFTYSHSQSFVWTADLNVGHSHFNADFKTAKTHLAAAAKLLKPEDSLSEAMFF
jgi:Glucose-6-phosphate dehydrogenase subunit